jgi:hypothetical protein
MRLTRRSVITALPLAAACAGADAPRDAVLYVMPDGDGDGSSWEEAASLLDLDELLSRVVPGGEIRIAADAGIYKLDEAIELSSGGRRGRPVRVRGVNTATGEPQQALLRGPVPDEDEMGPDAFRLLRGANELHFSHFAFERFGNGCFRIGAPISGLTIEDCAFEDVYRFLENTASDERHASVRGFAVRRCRGSGVVRGFARIRYGSSEGLFEDCVAQGLPNEGGDIPAGCALDDDAHHITFRRCVMENFQQWRAGDYWNGDGFSDEFGNHHIVYEGCEARGATDGGFDCKSVRVMLQDCLAEDNKRNFRIWSAQATLTRCTSRNPHYRGAGEETASACHIWIGDEKARIRIDQLTIEDRTGEEPILELDHDDARAEIRGITIRAPRENWGEDPEHVLAEMVLVR